MKRYPWLGQEYRIVGMLLYEPFVQILISYLFSSLATISGLDIERCDILVKCIPEVGLGVFAGKLWDVDDEIETSVGIPVPYKAILWTQLVNFVEGYNDTHGLLTLGHAMLYNHLPGNDQPMLRKSMTFAEAGIYRFREPFETSHDVICSPNSVILSGEQIFTHYGEDWFQDRNLNEIRFHSTNRNQQEDSDDFDEVNLKNGFASMKYNAEDDTYMVLPGCPTLLTRYHDCFTGTSTTASTNYRSVHVSTQGCFESNQGDPHLVAARDITAGVVIEVARAILLPEWAVEGSGPLEEIVWWSPSTTSSGLVPENVSTSQQQQRDNGSSTKSTKRRPHQREHSPYHPEPYGNTNQRYTVLLTGRGPLYGASSAFSSSSAAPRDTAMNRLRDDSSNGCTMLIDSATHDATGPCTSTSISTNDTVAVQPNVKFSWWSFPTPQEEADNKHSSDTNRNANSNSSSSSITNKEKQQDHFHDGSSRSPAGSNIGAAGTGTTNRHSTAAGGVECESLMMVAFTAATDIKAGEPLIVDLSIDVRTKRRFVPLDFAQSCL